MYMTRAELRRVAATLGHADLQVTQTPVGRWYATCSCGYRSTNKLNSAQAVGSAVHHFELIARKFTASGTALPTDLTTSETA